TQLQDASFKPVDDFAGGLDLTRGTLAGSVMKGEHLTVWREGDVRMRSEKPSRVRAVHLGWNNTTTKATGRYRMVLPEAAGAELRLDAGSRLVFALADTRDDPGARRNPLDFTIELETLDGVVARQLLSRIAPLPPLPRTRFTKWRFLDREF